MVSGVTVPKETTAAATIVEDEGTTTVLALADAERLGVRPDFVAAWLTVEAYSALDAVGLTAVLASALAGANIACNVPAMVNSATGSARAPSRIMKPAAPRL